MAARQTAIIQSADQSFKDDLPTAISHTEPVPTIYSAYHVLVRVLAVALNPIDYKMVTHFPVPGNMVGCDFCGIVVDKGASAAQELGTRVCGASFPYSRQLDDSGQKRSGAFASFLETDSRLLLRVPDSWDDAGGAALGQVGWATVALALSDPNALALAGVPSAPAVEREPVLAYGAATATGTMACQLLALSGYEPVAITSTQSASLAIEYGAKHTAAYTSPSCVNSVHALAGAPIRHILDCITSADSANICFAVMARTGGRYACLEGLPQNRRRRQVIKVKEVMGYEGHGYRVQVGTKDETYSRDANPVMFAICCRWAVEMQKLLDAGKLKHHPVRQLDGRWDAIIEGLDMLKRDEVRGHKLVVRIADAETASRPVG